MSDGQVFVACDVISQIISGSNNYPYMLSPFEQLVYEYASGCSAGSNDKSRHSFSFPIWFH